MLDEVINTFVSITAVLGLTDDMIRAAALALPISWFGTQAIKTVMQLEGSSCVIVGFIMGAVPCFIVVYDSVALGVSLTYSVSVGFTAPVLYKIVIVVAKRRGYTGIVAALSNDGRNNDSSTK